MPSSTYEERVAFGKLPEEQREELFRKMTPEERSDISGYGTEDAPGYCDMNGHCYSYEDDAECADSYIKEIEELKEEISGLQEKLDKGTEQHIADIEKLNKFYMKTKEENEKLQEQLQQKTMIYSILDETYKGMSKSKQEWIDVNWKSIINGFADNLEEMVPKEDEEEE